jgi:phosphoenolpyruvate synthase/pyruvate phosphate dikinase
MDTVYLWGLDDTNSQPSVDLVGGKCSQLARIAHLGLPVPRWCCVTTDAFYHFLSDHHMELPQAALATDQARAIREKLQSEHFSAPLQDSLIAAGYSILSHCASGALVVRSSATLEDSQSAAFPGQFDTFLGITDPKELPEKVRLCWASLWSDRAITYFLRQKRLCSLAMAVIIQDFVASDIAGVMFTANPTTGRRDEIVIESSWGLGDMVVGGKVIPDHFLVKRRGDVIERDSISAKLGSKRRTLQWNPSEHRIREQLTPPILQKTFTLNEERVCSLANIGLLLETQFGCPQDIEWAFQEGQLYLLQTRPVTTLFS